MGSVVDDDQRRTPSWLFMGPKDGLRKRRSGSSDSLLSVSDDESLPGTSTPSKALEKGSFLKSWLPMLSPKKLQWQSNNSLCDSGFQDTLLTPEAARHEGPEVQVLEKEPRQSSAFLAYALPVAVMLAIFGALGFGLMMMNKDTAEVDQLNGKYKSMQYARERIQTAANEKGDDSASVRDLDYNYVGEERETNPLYLDYPDDPKFRSHSQGIGAENDFENSNTNDHENRHAEHDELMDYPDYPEFRASFV